LRIHEEYGNNPDHLHQYTKQDSIVLNLQRACEASIDIAMHAVSELELGIPQTSRDAFDLLVQNGKLESGTGQRMKQMVGFRNVAVHDYRSIQLPIVQSILDHHLVDFETYIREISELL